MAAKQADYTKLNAELDAILDELQSGELDIDEATAKYERGMRIIEDLQEYLAHAENSVKKVKAKFES